MPALNRRGPEGEGAMTGKKMGRCNPENKGKTDEEIIRNRSTSTEMLQRGHGRGRGFGRGFGEESGRGKGLGRGRGRGKMLRFEEEV